MKYILFALLVFCTLFSCRRDSRPVVENNNTPCGAQPKMNSADFSTATSDTYIITKASISGNCLSATLGLGSACSDPTIELLHVASDAAVYPPQHELKIILHYGTGCAMPGSKTFNFDLSPLKQKGTNKLAINLVGYNETLEYSY